MRRFTLLLVCFVLLAFSLPAQELTPEAAAAAEPDGAAETMDLWFVELSSPPTADGTSLNTVRAEKQAFRKAAAAAGLTYTERRSFDVLFNGFSVRINPADVTKLSRIAGVKAVYPVVELKLDPTEVPGQLDMTTALVQTGADIAQNSLGLTGQGIKVGIIDTGIDLDHPAFGETCSSTNFPSPGCRIITGYDFVGDAYTGANSPVEDQDVPDDCAGHGSHVAGIVGANGQIKGVAPNVSLAAYRVFGCAGSTATDIMIAAMERALADGMHIINMSIGSVLQWPQYPTAVAATRLVNKGVVVVTSIGNSGETGTQPLGLYAAGAPGTGAKVIGVASFNNTHQNFGVFRITPDSRAVGYSNATGANSLAPLEGTGSLARTGTQASTADACVALPGGSLSGKIALIRRGTCGFYVKAMNAQNAGAVGVVIYNNTTGFITPNVAPVAPATAMVTIPVVGITAADGNLIDTRLASGPVDLTWTGETLSVPLSATSAGFISTFSSYGLAADLSFKPNLGAPGGTIRSTYPVELGGYTWLSGTSMASPHVAGAVALLLEAKPNTPPNAVNTILQNSSVPKFWWGNPALGLLDQTHRQGAGMLNIANSITATTRVEPSSLPLGESQAGPATRTLTLRNFSSEPVTYNLSHNPALATGMNTVSGLPSPYFSSSNGTMPAFNAAATVAFSAPSVLVPAGGTASVDVTITAPANLPDFGLYGGYIVLTPDGSGQTYRVPFAGLTGDYQALPVLTPTTCNFPAMARINLSASAFNCTTAGVLNGFSKVTGGTFSLVVNSTTDDRPYFLLHLNHHVRSIRMEVLSASGKSWHEAGKFEYVSRNTTLNGFFFFTFDGVTANGSKLYPVPDGDYVVKFTIVKALGDPTNPAHVETWSSPVFTVDRP